MEIIYPQCNTDGGHRGKCSAYRKVIFDCVLDDYALVENDMVWYKGKWGMLNGDNHLLIPAEYSFIDCIRNDTQFKVAKGDLIIHHSDEPSAYIAAGAKWGVINENNEVVLPIEYDWVEEVAMNSYAVNMGGTLEYNGRYQEDYWFARDGKWGVINSENEIIIPIEYDAYFTSCWQYKGIFPVQKGSSYFDDEKPYDVFDFKGNLLCKNIQGPVMRVFPHLHSDMLKENNIQESSPLLGNDIKEAAQERYFCLLDMATGQNILVYDDLTKSKDIANPLPVDGAKIHLNDNIVSDGYYVIPDYVFEAKRLHDITKKLIYLIQDGLLAEKFIYPPYKVNLNGESAMIFYKTMDDLKGSAVVYENSLKNFKDGKYEWGFLSRITVANGRIV